MNACEASLWGAVIQGSHTVILAVLRSLHAATPVTEMTLKQYAAALFVLKELYRAWQTSRSAPVICTVRDLYYRSPLLFHQSGPRGVQTALLRLARWLSVNSAPPHDANAAQRWLARPAQSEAPQYTRETLGVIATATARLVGHLVLVHGARNDEGEENDDGQRISLWGLGGLSGVALSWSLIGPGTVRFGFNGLTDRDSVVRVLKDLRRAPAGGISSSGLNLLECLLLDALQEAAAVSRDASTAPLALIVVEKECGLHALLHGPLGQCLAQTCLVLCTRGYPCVAARHALRRFHVQWPSVPMCQLVDADPHGVAILLTTMGLPLANPAEGDRRVHEEVPSRLLPITWVALKPSTLVDAASSRTFCRGGRGNYHSAVAIPLTPRDTQLLERLHRVVYPALARLTQLPQTQDSDITSRCLACVLRELSHMQRSRVKHELEAALCG